MGTVLFIGSEDVLLEPCLEKEHERNRHAGLASSIVFDEVRDFFRKDFVLHAMPLQARGQGRNPVHICFSPKPVGGLEANAQDHVEHESDRDLGLAGP